MEEIAQASIWVLIAFVVVVIAVGLAILFLADFTRTTAKSYSADANR